MDVTTPIAPTAAPTVAPTGQTTATHPLIWAALVVWLSVEAIGDGLLAVRSLLASLSSSRSVTPS